VPSVDVELRAAFRYGLSANVLFSWEEQGPRANGQGVTRDMSTNGLFVYSKVLPPENASLGLEVGFPPLQEGSAPVRIKVRGRVVRVEREPAEPFRNGFAVSSESTSWLSCENSGTRARATVRVSSSRLLH
jgi:PilZ domain